MKHNFFVFNSKELISFSILILVIIFSVGFGVRQTNNVIETGAVGKRLLPIYSVERNDKKVALTFDCAWGADDIESIVETLENNNIKASFFVVGSWVDKYPDVVHLLAEAGNDIGNHSNNHAHVNKLSLNDNINDMKKCNEKIEMITGKKVKLYRGPYGEYNDIVISAAKELRMSTIQWDVDTLDYTGKTVEEMCTRIKDKIRSGSIILMHNDTEYTAKGLQTIIDTVIQLGYEIVPVSELIYYDNFYIDNTGRQIHL